MNGHGPHNGSGEYGENAQTLSPRTYSSGTVRRISDSSHNSNYSHNTQQPQNVNNTQQHTQHTGHTDHTDSTHVQTSVYSQNTQPQPSYFDSQPRRSKEDPNRLAFSPYDSPRIGISPRLGISDIYDSNSNSNNNNTDNNSNNNGNSVKPSSYNRNDSRPASGSVRGDMRIGLQGVSCSSGVCDLGGAGLSSSSPVRFNSHGSPLKNLFASSSASPSSPPSSSHPASHSSHPASHPAFSARPSGASISGCGGVSGNGSNQLLRTPQRSAMDHMGDLGTPVKLSFFFIFLFLPSAFPSLVYILITPFLFLFNLIYSCLFLFILF